VLVERSAGTIGEATTVTRESIRTADGNEEDIEPRMRHVNRSLRRAYDARSDHARLGPASYRSRTNTDARNTLLVGHGSAHGVQA